MIAAPYTAGELVVLIGSLTSGVCAVLGAFFAGVAAMRSGRNQRATEAVHDEVRTLNGATIGDLIDQRETRRIDQIPAGGRTTAENDHMQAVPIADIRDKPLGE